MTQLELAQMLGVARQTVAGWKREGVDLTNLEDLRRRAAAIITRRSTTEDHSAAKLRKLTADADASEIRAKQMAGALVERAGLVAQAEGVGLATRQMQEKLANSLPPMLAGRSAAEIAKILQREFRAALQQLADTPPQRFIANLSKP